MSRSTFSYSQWFRDQIDPAVTPTRSLWEAREELRLNGRPPGTGNTNEPTVGNAGDFQDFLFNDIVTGAQPLRNMTAYALNQFLVVSSVDPTIRSNRVMGFWETLQRNALGNYRTLLQDISLNGAMANYLTFFAKGKADPVAGTFPDENYAREVMQLFSIGLFEMEMDGSPRLAGGEEVPTYSQDDIAELARVFTGFILNDPLGDLTDERRRDPTHRFNQNFGGPNMDFRPPLAGDPAVHDWDEKTFLGRTLPATPDPANQTEEAMRAEVRAAADIVFEHPNVAPFVAERMIKFLVAESPRPQYIEYAATAFEVGRFILPDGSEVGSGERGCMTSLMAAIMFHADAHTLDFADPAAGKMRSPYVAGAALRRWVGDYDAAFPPLTTSILESRFYESRWDPSQPSNSLQLPCFQPSVFGYGRPDHVPAGTPAGDAGLTSPGLQAAGANEWTEFAISVLDLRFTSGLSRGVEAGKFLGDLIPAMNAEFDADTDAYCDALHARFFGGQLSPETLGVMKVMSAKLKTALDNGGAGLRGNIDMNFRSICPLSIGCLSIEFQVQR